MWGEEYNIEKDPINELTKIYIRINEACKNDEQILENCRNNFKKLEDGDPYCVEIWKKFRELSLQEFQKVYDLLGSKFDSWNGESFYVDKVPEVLERLEKLKSEIKDMDEYVRKDVDDDNLKDEDIFRINEKIKDLEKQILNIIEG